MSDPELAAGFSNPKIMKAFTSMMGGGGPNAESMKDPEVAAFTSKMMAKLGPMMGGMGGMPGGMGGGMGGMGGMGSGGMPSGSRSGTSGGYDDDDDDSGMPDLEEVE